MPPKSSGGNGGVIVDAQVRFDDLLQLMMEVAAVLEGKGMVMAQAAIIVLLYQMVKGGLPPADRVGQLVEEASLFLAMWSPNLVGN
jgi:hypothetical protein